MAVVPTYLLLVMAGLGLGFLVGREFIFGRAAGEVLVADIIKLGFRRLHVLFNDLTIETDRGTAQIDHLLVAHTGIFIIETKRYRGWIFGGPCDTHWTQVFFEPIQG